MLRSGCKWGVVQQSRTPRILDVEAGESGLSPIDAVWEAGSRRPMLDKRPSTVCICGMKATAGEGDASREGPWLEPDAAFRRYLGPIGASDWGSDFRRAACIARMK